uniref:Uncharacterized protein n=1 Tax=Setaria italica TaxID=4555 RepID=K3YXM5_SETIT
MLVLTCIQALVAAAPATRKTEINLPFEKLTTRVCSQDLKGRYFFSFQNLAHHWI